jgi:hypothetical protein
MLVRMCVCAVLKCGYEGRYRPAITGDEVRRWFTEEAWRALPRQSASNTVGFVRGVGGGSCAEAQSTSTKRPSYRNCGRQRFVLRKGGRGGVGITYNDRSFLCKHSHLPNADVAAGKQCPTARRFLIRRDHLAHHRRTPHMTASRHNT